MTFYCLIERKQTHHTTRLVLVFNSTQVSPPRVNSSPSDVTAVIQRQPVIIKGFLLFVTLKQSGGRVWRSLAQEGTANQSLLHATQLDQRKGSRHTGQKL